MKKSSKNQWREKARRLSFPLGWEHGYHMGRVHAITTPFEQEPKSVLWDKKVLYISSGKGMPYSPLDEAVIQEASTLVRELVVATPKTNVSQFAALIRPDFVFSLEGLALPVEQVDNIRQLNIPIGIWLTDDPYYTDLTESIAPHYDFVFTLEANAVDFYKSLGCEVVHYLPFGVNTSIFRHSNVSPSERLDFSFLGSAYWNRVHFMEQALPALRRKKYLISGLWWKRMANYRRYAPKMKLNHWLSPQNTARIYSSSKIVINLHRRHDDVTYNYNSRNIPALSVNPRTFEIAACATLQLTDERDELKNMYVPNFEVATFSSPADLVEKVNYYLTHEKERREIALRGLKRTLQDHTYRNRLTTLFSLVFG